MLWLSLGTERLPLRQGETTLGRSPYCTVIVNSGSASREHAAIVVDGGVTTLSDIGSRNGTAVNGKKIANQVTLVAGDVVGIGTVALKVIEGPRGDDTLTSTSERKVPTEPPPPPRLTMPELATGMTAPPPGDEATTE